MFTPKFDTKTVKQVVCSNACCLIHYERQKVKTKRQARLVAGMVGKRSMGEVRFAAEHLEPHIKRIKVAYEPAVFPYESPAVEHSYTPDFRVTLPSGKVYYIEYKGVLDLETRKKMILVRDQHPELDIRFVFQRAANKIIKGSKTTYGMWANKNGFQWADNRIPKQWLKR